MRAWPVGLLVSVALLAGCADTPTDGEDLEGGADDAAPPLQGWVFDDALRPLDGVRVELQQTLEAITTDATGHYQFSDVPVDEPIVLVAKREAYIVASKQVVVREGVAVQLNFTLVPVPPKEPRVVVVPLEGFLSCQGTVAAGGYEVPLQCAGEEAQDMWDVAAGEDLAGIVVEVAWESGQPLSDHLHATLATLSLGDQNHDLAEATGPSILRLEVGENVTSRIYPQGGLMRVTVESAGDPAGAPAGASLHVSQEFQVFVSLFYVDPPAPGYTVGQA